MQSSDIERGAAGRVRALNLRNAAQASLEATCNAATVDCTLLDFTLAEGALVNTPKLAVWPHVLTSTAI